MALGYQITYTPQSFYVVAHETNLGVKSWNILTRERNQPVAFTFDENMAKTIVLALELVHAQIRGDTMKSRELTKLIDKLSVR